MAGDKYIRVVKEARRVIDKEIIEGIVCITVPVIVETSLVNLVNKFIL